MPYYFSSRTFVNLRGGGLSCPNNKLNRLKSSVEPNKYYSFLNFIGHQYMFLRFCPFRAWIWCFCFTYPGRRFACPGLCASLGFQPALVT